ncbi:type II toxin-antitoxin system VapC family toxin [Falsiroseomonas sp. E2-1-a20]|uniref:type II toxin-antitoxin system VapC family toxin n=1 Tax=Falsiroseomonas sp. E2-1-a20 TaxID=3239300 RepID=UPI003F2A5872
MTALVLDASATAPWFLIDEADAASDALLLRVAQSGALVPAIWHFEVASILRSAERRSRFSVELADQVYGRLATTPISTEMPELGLLARRLHHLARQHALTPYDAAYLDLAIRRRLPLATRDAALIRAAPLEGVPLLPA